MEKDANKFLNRIMFSLQQPAYSLPVMRENKSQEYITWGEDNDYGTFITNLYLGSSLHSAILDRKKAEIIGLGLQAKNKLLKGFVSKCNQKGESLQTIFNKITFDYLLTGGFCFEIVYTKGTGKIAEIYYKDVTKFRFNPTLDKIKEAKNWSLQRVSVITYDLYDESDKTGRKIFYFRGDAKNAYPVPQYVSSISSIQADIEISNFWLAQIQNGLFPALHIDMKNGEPDSQSEKDALERTLQNKFGGSSKAGRMFITFSDAENPSPTITAVPQPDLDKKFQSLQSTIQEKMFLSSGLPAILLGELSAGKLGAGTIEITQQSENFRNAYVTPTQNILLEIFNNVLSTNFADELTIKPLKPINSVINDPVLIASQLTRNELRTLFVEYGYIDQIEIPDGEFVIGETAAESKKQVLKPLGEENVPGSQPPDQPAPDANNPETPIA